MHGGADAVMLSGETSVGKYPVQVIKKMSDILRSVENSELIKVPQLPPHIRTNRYITKSICYHAANMANEISAQAISTLTNSGYTAFQISAWRPSAHILVFTSTMPAPKLGEEVLIQGQVKYQSIPISGQEFGDVYIEQTKRLELNE